MKYSDIKSLTKTANYQVNIPWRSLIENIERYSSYNIAPLNLNPEFQRGHVWTLEQQIAYVEFKLRGGFGSNTILLNCPGWMNDFRGPFVLVDGKQRLEAVRKFLLNKLPVFGYFYNDFEDSLSYNIDFIFKINNLEKNDEVLNWYLELNSGGTPHTPEELLKVKNMIDSKS